MYNTHKILSFILCFALISTAFSACSSSASPDSPADKLNSTSVQENAADAADSSEPEYVQKLFSKDVIKIEISTTDEDWKNLIDNAVSKPTIKADVTIDGEKFDSVGIKTKGNTSLSQIADSDSDRYSLKLNFGKYTDSQTCYGLDKLVLNNIYADSTYLKEYMSYSLFQYMNVPGSLAAFADIYVNGEHYGFYLALEDVEQSFIDRNYSSDSGVQAYKPEGMKAGGNNGGQDMRPDSNFDPANGEQTDQSFSDDSSQSQGGETSDNSQAADNSIQPPTNGEMPQGGFQPPTDGEMPQGGMQPPADGEMPQNGMQPPFDGQMPQGGKGGMDGGKNGVDLVYSDDETSSYSNIFDNAITDASDEDYKRVITSLKGISEGDAEKYIDVDEVLRYTAANVFLVNLDSYFSSMAHNYCLAENNGVLSMIPWDYNLSFGSFQSKDSSSVINYAIDTVFDGVTFEDRPIIGKLLENEDNMETYHKYLRQIAEEYVQGGIFEQTVDHMYSVIDEYVKNDESSFNGYDAFTKGVPALKLFGTLRAQSIMGQLDSTIPSTQDEQKNSDKLIDSSALDMSLLGTMNMGGGMDGKGHMNADNKNVDKRFSEKQDTQPETTAAQTAE